MIGEISMLTPALIRGARAMLEISQAELAAKAGISKTGLANIEIGKANSRASTLAAIQRALEATGVEFIGDGVRMMPFSFARFALENGIFRRDGASLYFAEKQEAIDCVSREIRGAQARGEFVGFNHERDYWWFAPEGKAEQRRARLSGPLGNAINDINATLNVQLHEN